MEVANFPRALSFFRQTLRHVLFVDFSERKVKV